MDYKKKKTKSKQISVFNWMVTLLLCSIPGVNLISLLCFAILGKTRSKRHFAVAVLLWMVISLLLCVGGLLIWPEQAKQLAEILRTYAQPASAAVAP